MMENIFTKHPNEIGETYLEHGLQAMRYSLTFFCLTFVVFLHAIFPFWFKKTASCVIQDMSDHLKEREGDCKEAKKTPPSIEVRRG